MFGIAASLAASGRHVVVGAGGPEPASETVLDEVDGPGSVRYIGLGERPAPGAPFLAASVETLLHWGRRTVRWLESQELPPSHVLVHGGQAAYILHLRKWCRQNDVPLIVDVVDWWNGHHVRGGYFGPLHASMKLALRHYYPRCDGIIVISSYLEDFYRSSGKPILRVPPTLDVKSLPMDARKGADDSRDLILVYAGRPYGNKKDQLGTTIEAVGRLEREGRKIELRVYGPSPNEVRELVRGNAIPKAVRCFGRVPQTEVASAVQEADFSVLIRRPDRTSAAGVATKFCESLANGTPVIANLTSDMGDFLRHGSEGLVCRDHTVGEVEVALRIASDMPTSERRLMRQAARSQALASFDYRAHSESLGNFLRQWP
ncbi:glycosyltransferase family 4 protein [Nucisporomicrobium flavum]|uniref:glycosyltransferase family 4 protein n=1 Tax=Nucisporomicrobium flavum TaxID=2785915 RepID=UPI003C2FF134